MPSNVSDLEWRGERLVLRPAGLGDVAGIVAFHRELEGIELEGVESAVDGFAAGGPWMDEYFCSRHLQAYVDLGWDCWVVERDGEAIAGSVEVLYATEPEPFGRYAHLEYLELGDLAQYDEVEEWVLDQCEARAVARGYDRFWCRPLGSGGSPHVLARRGYVERWRSAWLTVGGLGGLKAPAFEERPIEGDYDEEVAHLLALNHRESASYRWRYLWRAVLTPEASDYSTDMSLWGRRVTLEGRPSAVVLVSIRTWRDPRSAWVDIWVEPELAGDAGYVSELVSVAGRQAFAMGARSMEVVVPVSLGREVEGRFEAEAVELEGGDPWLMKVLRALSP